MAFHAQPDIVEEPAGKRQEPQTPILCFTLLIRCVTAAISPAIPFASPKEEETRVFCSYFAFKQFVFIYTVCLASSGSDLLLSTLGTLLAHVSLGLALGGGGSALGLVGLLGGLNSSLLLLVGLDGLGASGRPGLGAHGAALLDDLERGTNDGTLGLDGAAGALLGNFLQRGSVTLSGICFRLVHISSPLLSCPVRVDIYRRR